MSAADLTELLRCPQSGQPLTVASDEVVASAKGLAKEQFDGGLVREDGRVLYPMCDGIPIMLAERAILLPLPPASAPVSP